MKMTKPGGATSGLRLTIVTVIVIVASSAWAVRLVSQVES